ncbi:MAG: PepSY domain-containing protein [Gudongella sp.]|nr:PepSY domain-containing protein [Gudongella sp.]
MKKRILFISIALILVFAMVACTPNPTVEEPPMVEEPEVVEPDMEIPEEPEVEEDDNEEVSYEEIKLTPMDAFDIYREEYPDKLVKKIELDKYFDSYVYKVEGYNDDDEIEIKIDPVNGDIIDTDTELDMDLDRQGEITIAKVEMIQEFLDKSLLDAGTGTMVDEWTLEWNEGILELEIDINLPERGDIDYTYNIETSELIEKDE